MKYTITLLFVLLFFSAHSQSIVYVTQNGAGNQSGVSWSDALPGTQLQSRLASAGSGTQFWVASGFYYPTNGNDRNVTFFIPSGVQVYGGFTGYVLNLADRVVSHPSSTVFSGEIGNFSSDSDNSFHVVSFKNASSATRLDGVMVAWGYGGAGGGIYNDGSGAGGNSEPTIHNCFITNNKASNGGGIHNNGYQGSANPTISNCILTGNLAFNNGGGVYNNGYQGVCNPRITNCLSYSNTARDGGAYYDEAYQGTCRPLIQNCTIANNRSTASNTNYGSGAFYNDAPQQGDCSPMLRNCIIWGNTAESTPATITSIFNNGSINLIISYSDVQDGYPGVGNIQQDPVFKNLSVKDFRLSVPSPAINAGDPTSTHSSIATSDLDGRSRLIVNRIDMGSYECNSRFGNGKIVYITPSGSGDHSGSSWVNSLPGNQFSDVLPEAAPGTSFWLSKGTYRPTTGGSRFASFNIPSGVQVYGSFKGTELMSTQREINDNRTVLSGDIGTQGNGSDNSYHVIQFKNTVSSTRLDGMIIRDGNDNFPYLQPKGGGGVYNDGSGIDGAYGDAANLSNRSNPTLENCLIIANQTAYNGAGFYNDGYIGGASPTLLNCFFEQNRSESTGGGIYVSGSRGICNLILTSCGFLENEAIQGGAFAASASFTTSENNSIFNKCFFTGNKATMGGAVSLGSLFGASILPRFINCLFAKNNAKDAGGAISLSAFAYAANNPRFINCTLVNNTAVLGSGMYSTRYNDSGIIARLENSIVRNNEFAYEAGSNRIAPTYNITYSNIQGGFAGTGNIDQDPLFVDASNSNYRLRAGSPSINTGDPNSTAATVSDKDLDGNARVAENRIDMGAYEFQVAAQTGSDLSLNLRVDNRAPALNQPVTYFLTVTNNGPITATNVVWQNRLPNNLLFVGGSAINVNNNVLSGQIGSLAAGESTTFTYQLQPTQAAQYINAAQITASGQTDPDSQPNSGTGDGQDDAAIADFRTGAATGPVYTSANPDQVPLPPVQSNQPTPDPTKADLSLVMVITNRSPKADEVVTISIQVNNAGGLTATGVAGRLVLPNGVSFVSGNGFTASGQIITGNFRFVGARSSATLTCQVRIATGGNILFKAEVVACDQADPDSQPNSGVNDGQDDIATADLRVSQ